MYFAIYLIIPIFGLLRIQGLSYSSLTQLASLLLGQRQYFLIVVFEIVNTTHLTTKPTEQAHKHTCHLYAQQAMNDNSEAEYNNTTLF